jgi:hypothetical protein
MTSTQAKDLCQLFQADPNEAVGTEPRYIAIQRVFDPEAADAARAEHDAYWSTPRPGPKPTGKASKTLAPVKGGVE